MKRVFICGYFNFPRGGAASNYVQYISNVFKSMGYDVYIISNVNKEIISTDCRVKYAGLNIDPYQLAQKKIKHYLDFNFGMGMIISNKLKRYNLRWDDIVIAYSRDFSTLLSVLRIGVKTGAKTGLCLVEWFEKKDYNKYLVDMQFWNSTFCFYTINKRFDFIMPISTYIEKYYKDRACKTFVMPCLVDTKEFGYTGKSVSDKRIFIFPGNGKMKDALYEMIKAFSLLSDYEVSQAEFHICGVGELAKKILKECNLENSLAGKIIIHNWMPYEELVELYRRAHFMILARDVSRMTLANFPSKIPETLSYGIIPICSRVGDYTKLYLIDGENSLIMDGCDVQTILLGIRRALAMTDQDIINYSNRCRITAETKFDYRQWVEPLNNFLETEVF